MCVCEIIININLLQISCIAIWGGQFRRNAVRLLSKDNMEYREKFIGFIDVLGFKQLVKASENGSGMPLQELMSLLENLGSPEDVQKFRKQGFTLCPESKYIQKDLDFQLTQISDCVIVSSEVSPAGAINLISHCSSAIIGLLLKGVMCRGYITKGKIYHTENQIIGSGYQQAYKKESEVTAFKTKADERGTPFVEIDSIVCEYIKETKDDCVLKMFNRFVKNDEQITALFPFQMFSHSFIIAGLGVKFDPQKEKQSNENLRLLIQDIKKRVMDFVDDTNLKAKTKAEYYISALETQHTICDETDEFIDNFAKR